MQRRHMLIASMALLAISACRKVSASDDHISLPNDVISRLEVLKAMPKFKPDEMYTGYQPPEHQPEAEKLINDLISRLEGTIQKHPSKRYLKSELSRTFDYFELSDTEDRERCLAYFEDIFQAIGMPKSGKEIGKWLYPFDPIGLATRPHLEQ